MVWGDLRSVPWTRRKSSVRKRSPPETIVVTLCVGQEVTTTHMWMSEVKEWFGRKEVENGKITLT